MTNTDIWIKSLEKGARLFKETRLQKLKKSPKKILYSKALELIALWLERSFRIKAKTFWGEDMTLLIPEVVSLHIYCYGFLEEDLTRMALECLRPGMTFFDVGAHFGYFTLLSSLLVGDSGQVHSFEPTPSTFDILKVNASNKKNVVLNNSAVFSRRQVVFINDYGIRYAAFNSIYDARLSKDIIRKLKPQQHKIDAIPIDEYVEKVGVRPDFIKIDAESSEYEIFLGMEKTITKFHPVVSIEIGDEGVTGIPTSEGLINFLLVRDYRPYELKGGKVFEHVLKNEKYEHGNIVFLPNL